MRRLDRVPMALFDGLEGEALEDVYWRLRPRHFEAGQVIGRAGEPGDSLLVLRQGLVHALSSATTGAAADPGVVARYRPGDVIGETALLVGEPRSTTLVAQLATDAFELRREVFLSLAARFPVLLVNLARILSRRLAAQTVGAARGRRAGAVAVVAGRRGLSRFGDLVATTRMASPRPLDLVDLTQSSSTLQATNEALAHLETAVRGGDTVIMLVRSDHRHLALLLDHVDRAVALMDPDEARELAARLEAPAARIELVELRMEGERPSEGSTPMRVIRSCAGELPDADLAWLGRHLAGTKLGLALGAGGAKGYAHVGVIRALLRAGYTIDYVAGTSIGAWVGAWLALGMDADAIEQTIRSQFTADVGEILYRRGAAGQPNGLELMARLARDTTAGRTFEQLGTPLVVMAADLHGRRPVSMATGPLHEALVTGMSVPGLYPPVDHAAGRLVDAVVLAPVPTEAVIAAGADVTVAVNLLGRETLPIWPGEQAPDSSDRPSAVVRDGLVEALEVAQIDAAARQVALADVSITPRFGPGTWRHFHLADRYLAAGEAAAKSALIELAALARPQSPTLA